MRSCRREPQSRGDGPAKPLLPPHLPRDARASRTRRPAARPGKRHARCHGRLYRRARAALVMHRVNLLYELLYLVGVRPWERAGITPELKELVEGPGALTPGRALDIGCGTGGPTVYLATRGWEVTGVDVVARALRRARARAAGAGVTPRFVHADVSRLADAPSVVGDYDLLFDSGCYHGLGDAQRATYGQAVGRLAAPGAALLLFALTPGGAARPRIFRGASDEELRARFERDWEFVWKRPHAGPSVFRSAGQFWHLLRRRTHL